MNTRDAFEQARLLEAGCAGPEHFLLALLATPNVASAALEGVGITYEGVRDHLRSLRHDPDLPSPSRETGKGITLNPAAHELIGWAHGLALASGSRSPGPEHWLVALLYRDDMGPSWLHGFQVGAGAVLDALASRGVPRPRVQPPEYRPWRGVRSVYVAEDELKPVIDLLGEKHPPGSEWRWGFNRVGEPRRGRVIAEEGIRLDEIVAEARARSPGS